MKKTAFVTTLCLKMEAGFDFWPADYKRRPPFRGVARAVQNNDYRRQGAITQVTPLTCCRSTDLACIKKRLAPQLHRIGQARFAEPKNWPSLATTEVMSL